jgi:hypothetical protein
MSVVVLDVITLMAALVAVALVVVRVNVANFLAKFDIYQ